MNLPNDLQIGLEQILQPASIPMLTRSTSELSQRYREGHSRDSHSFLHTREDSSAYAAYRLPATFAAIYAALLEVQKRQPGWQPRTLLDVGAGPGTAMWAVSSIWPTLEQATLLENDSHMLRLGQDLAKHAHNQAIRQAKWLHADVTGTWQTHQYDLVICSYVLGEIAQPMHEVLSECLWTCAKDTLLIVEPGTPRGFEIVRKIRAQLLRNGASVSAPCPHNDACPMIGSNWCHFAQRISRSRLHRAVKGGTLAYEDEKFSYVALTRHESLPIEGRILRHPLKRKGHIRLELCTASGLQNRVVARSAGQIYHNIQDLPWGSALEEGTGAHHISRNEKKS